MTPIRWMCVTMCLTGLWFVSACRAAEPTKEDIVAFNQALITYNQRLHDAGYKLGIAIGPVFREEEVDLPAALKQFRKTLQVLAGVRDDLKSLKVPDDPAARDLYAGYQLFLDFQVDVLIRDVPQVFDIIEDQSLTPAEKKEKVNAAIDNGNEKEQKAMTAARNARTTLSKQFGVELEER